MVSLRYILAILNCVACLLLSYDIYGQTYLETYGQNRVQTRKYDWKYFDTEHLRIFHYDLSGRHLARYVAEQAEKDIAIIEQKLGGKFPRKFHIVLYNNYDEYRQTNIGRKYDSQIQDIPAGTVDLVGDKLIVYFDGEHQHLKRQLRAGMSRVVMERIIFGDNFREMLRNAVLLNLSPWVTMGFVAYLVDGWNTENENEWKNILQANPQKDFYELADLYPEIAGNAFWKYIAHNYGENTMRNLLFTMQMKSSLNQGIKMTLNKDVKEIYKEVIKFYQEIYVADGQKQEFPDQLDTAILEIPVPKGNAQMRNILVSPRGHDVAYVVWENGEYKVFLQQTRALKEKSLIIAGGMKDYNEPPDPNYPLLAWSNNGYKLAILYKKGNQTRLRIYHALKAKLEDYILPANRFDRVLGMSFMEEDEFMVFSVIRKSQTDLYKFKIKGARLEPITQDPWDDIAPWFVSGGSRRGIVFLSNRPKPELHVKPEVNELPGGIMNVYFYDTRTQSPTLLQLSDISGNTISQPIQYGNDHFAFLYDKNGINNRYVVLFDRDSANRDVAYAVPATNYTHSIISHQYNPMSQKVAEVIQVGDKYKVYIKPVQIPGVDMDPKVLSKIGLSDDYDRLAPPEMPDVIPSLPENKIRKPAIFRKENTRKESILKSGDDFLSEFEIEEPVVTPEEKKEDNHITAETSKEVTNIPVPELAKEEENMMSPLDVQVDSTYVKLKPQKYRTAFTPDFFSVRIDNSILFNRYQPLNTDLNQNFGGMLTASINDVMENHRFTGGIRLPVNFTGMAYFLQYENFTRRVDWSLLFVRSQSSYKYDVIYTDSIGTPLFRNSEQIGKVATNILQGSASYPLDRLRSIRMSLAFRQDVTDYKAQDYPGLTFLEREQAYWVQSRLEYVYDNTTNPALNIRFGLRYKLYTEYMYRMSKPNGGFYNVGMDIRYYKRLYKNIIGAARAAYAYSAGNERVSYVMGGVDNWLFPRQTGFPPANSNDYAFQALTTNLRGYEQNSRRGGTYGLINLEVRAPILTTILRKPIQSGFLKNLQAIAFTDAGATWNGILPTSSNMSETYIFGTLVPPAQPVYVIMDGGNNGLALGYGLGIRTMLFGYFMRLDAAWNIDGRKIPLWHFSIGTDF